MLVSPASPMPRKNPGRRSRLVEEHGRRRGDPVEGGGSRKPIMTAYRQRALACAAALAKARDVPGTLRRTYQTFPKSCAATSMGGSSPADRSPPMTVPHVLSSLQRAATASSAVEPRARLGRRCRMIVSCQSEPIGSGGRQPRDEAPTLAGHRRRLRPAQKRGSARLGQGVGHVLRRRPCSWRAGTPTAQGERSAQSFQRFLKRPAASSVYRTVFEMFLWPRYACKVRVSVPRLARA